MADLSTYPKDVMQAAINALRKNGILNLEVQAAVLAVIAKESEFKPKSETSYAGTSNARIRKIFGARLKSLTELQLTTLKSNPVAFFDFLYGGRYGNSATEGYKYRGRGLNQITFKDNYKAIGNLIGVDLVKNPDLLNDPKIAAAAAAAYFIIFFKAGKSSGQLKKKIGVNDVSEIKDTTTAVKAVIQANAGWNTDFNANVVQEGYKKALSTVTDFRNGILNAFSSVARTISENKGATGAALFFLHWQQLAMCTANL
ncbi:MAG: glycoside hydrolase family 19 protein [Bacteroidia bacterium]|nr:glycoside hydrolase family 19 protein [Bacteroidia bacterium]